MCVCGNSISMCVTNERNINDIDDIIINNSVILLLILMTNVLLSMYV